MSEEKENEEQGITLKVKRSPISGSGIIRVHESVLEGTALAEAKPALLRKGRYEVVVRIVADDLMARGMVSLRQKDMERLRVKEGGEVVLLEYVGIRNKLGERLKRLRRKGN